MNWTKTPPAKRGIYWAGCANSDLPPIIVELYRDGHDIVGALNEARFHVDTFDLWYGPIAPPPLPAKGGAA